MANQSPYMTFSSAHCESHIAARITADRLPNDSVAACVRLADADCKILYEARADALRRLEAIDRVYMETWDMAYRQATEEQNEHH